ncbi:RING finger domain protein [Sphaerosporella brunnea]|uniref:RING finger domain protein n=1 Tax=Sphaerosporella brunnea TaxID=1250544 RepID=A0A5J5EV50_9PEZI|nr:RING finger domain protein [Sphaerosporella brunnea]
MDSPPPLTTGFAPTQEQATFRFASSPSLQAAAESSSPVESPPSPTARSPTPSNYRSPFVEDVPEPRRVRTPSPPPAPAPNNTTTTDDDHLRKCRICFETSAPPYTPSSELGRLISPCVCRGSSRYVHQGCLQTWRETSRDAFYVCPTCKYPYRLQRLSYAGALSSTTTTFFATMSIMVLVVWVLGFASGPILAAYLVDIPDDLDLPVARGGWAEHFLRGLASLGLLGFFKVIYLLGPGSWWNIRNSGLLGGRERVSRISWFVVAFGVANFFIWLWNKVGAVVRERMDKMAGDVLEVGDGGDGEERVQQVPWGAWLAGGAAQAWEKTRDAARRVVGA